MAGYWQRPDETAEVLGRDGFLHTGDIGVMDEKGFIRVVDRKKDMIVVSGFKVFPNEIEQVVAMLPGVLECAVIGVPDEHSGEVPKVFVVKRGPQLTEQDVLEHCRKELTGYKRPKYVELRAELPKTNVGKILLRALRYEKNAARKSGSEPVFQDEVTYAGKNHLAPAPSAEDAVVADARRDEVLAPLARDVQAERVRRLGLPVPGNVVELAFDGEEGDVADRLRPHQLVAHEHPSLRQREFLEHGFHRVEVVLGGHVEHGVVFVIEAPVRLGGFAVA